MGGIPPADLSTMLDQVVQGAISLKQFQANCLIYKAKARMQTLILQQIGKDDWVEAQRSDPKSCAIVFVDRWAQHIVQSRLKVSDSMPGPFFEDLQARREMDAQRQNLQSGMSEQVQHPQICHLAHGDPNI